MPSAYSVPMASDVLPDPDTPTTATVRHSGTSTSISRKLLCRAPRTPMTVGRVPGTGMSAAVIPRNLRPSASGCSLRRDLRPERHHPPRAQHPPDQPVPRLTRAADGHEILDLTHPFLGEETGDQHVGIREIELTG